MENGKDVLQEAGWGGRAERVLRAGLNLSASLGSPVSAPGTFLVVIDPPDSVRGWGEGALWLQFSDEYREIL